MKTQLFLISVFCALNANAQDYLITFTGTGASANVSTVKVENLTAGTSLIINGNDILHLKAIITGANTIKDDQSSEIKIYPNPMSDNATMQIYAPVAGDALITVLDITGKPVTRIQSYLENSRQDFTLAGLKTGFYFINVKGNNYQLSEKLLSKGQSGRTISIEKVNVVVQNTEVKAPEKVSKGVPATVDMAYTTGDRLKFTGTSGIFSTVIIDIPTSGKTINFNFIICSDPDNNNYPIVVIGTQTWMAENLKTTKYNDGIPVTCITDSVSWANADGAGYCWYNNDEARYKTPYGALYNYSAASSDKLCPSGWYLPAYSDWTTLTNYLKNNGYGYSGGGSNIAKSMAASSAWITSSPAEPGSICNDLAGNNSSGFTALPAGIRSKSGQFQSIEELSSWWNLIETRYFYPSGICPGDIHTYNIDKSFHIGDNISIHTGQSVRCLYGKSLTTAGVRDMTQTTAVSGGDIKNDAGDPIIRRGVCWSISSNPTIDDNKTVDGAGIGTFTSSLNDLIPNTSYHIRAYSTNIYGTNYGDDLIFKTYSGTVTDVDGNVYPTVQIGTQTWTAANLKTTKYNDGTSIPLVTESGAWATMTTPGYGWLNNDESAYKEKYGAVYNFPAVDAASNNGKNICPAGWHVPTYSQWTVLFNWLVQNGYSFENKNSQYAKTLSATTGWYPSVNPGAPGNHPSSNNSSGFTGIPGGDYWWTSSRVTMLPGIINIMSNYAIVNYASYTDWTMPAYVRCLKGDLILPVLTTSRVTSVTQNSAISGGNIINDNGDPITKRGVCWSGIPNPTYYPDYRTEDGSGTGEFTSSLKNLYPSTTYYLRAYAINSSCTIYGNEIRFCTWPKVSDIDGNIYNTINIGTQIWMVENLKTTRYNNGDLIGTTSPATKDIRSEDTPGYQWAYEGNENNVETYGRLYTWYAVNDSRKLCPTGLDVPTQADWTVLTDYLGGLGVSGGKLKEAGTNHWLSPNTGATNETGFTALPGGYRLSSGGFGGLGSDGAWRSSTLDNTNEDWTIGMGNSYTDAYGSSNGKRSGYSVRCFKQIVLPTITTSPASIITSTSAYSGGVLTSDGGSTITSRGVCWSTSENPTVLNNKTTDGSGIVSFVSSITGLTVETTYYVRAYATNIVGTVYGNQVSFTTRREPDPVIYNPDMTYGSITDIDGNSYKTIQIGTQTWMAENLKTTHYTDGSSITLVTSNTTWNSLKTEAYCAYNNDLSMLNVYGALYNWFTTTDTRHICPVGWHVPADAEWSTLTTFLGGQTLAGGKMKEIGTNHWLYPNTGADNLTGFTGLGAGRRYYDGFGFLGQQAVWLSTTVYTDSYVLSRMLLNNDATIATYNPSKNDGCSVRCLKD